MPEREDHEGQARRQPRGESQHERTRVFLKGRAVALDAVEPVQDPFHLAHQRGGRDQGTEKPENEADPLARHGRGLRLSNGLGQHLAGRSRDRSLDDVGNDVAETAASEHRCQAHEADDPLQQDQGDHERQ